MSPNVSSMRRAGRPRAAHLVVLTGLVSLVKPLKTYKMRDSLYTNYTVILTIAVSSVEAKQKDWKLQRTRFSEHVAREVAV